jgi:hypothetical protein
MLEISKLKGKLTRLTNRVEDTYKEEKVRTSFMV